MDKIDTQGMYKVYDRWHEIARKAYESDLEPVDFTGIDHIIFAGMGGSGSLGDLFFSVLSKSPIHVTLVKGYLLPKTVDPNSLVIATSVSGNTVETLYIAKTAKKLGCKLVCFSSGGKLEEFCRQNQIEHRHITMHKNPRSSFPAYVYSVLKVLDSVIPINKTCIETSLSEMESLSKKISSNNLSESNPSISLTQWLDDIPLIYYPWGLQAAAIRFKNSIQENMKSHAMYEDVIEACHNGIVSWESKSNITPILIRGSEDYIKTKERWEILKQYFKENSIDFKEIYSIEGDIFSKIICLIYLLDFATIYGAISKGIDPSPVKSIDYIKEHL
ncbi:SIS domain-containing protein [Nitrosopumilus sp. S4]